jgi:iron(II)-dependent oxidoreductase
MYSPAQLVDWVHDARQRTCELVADLDDQQMLGPHLSIVNPLLWEIGHVAWFQEKWVLRRSPNYRLARTDADALYDSAAIAHDTRWGLLLPGREATLRYLDEVRDRVIEHMSRPELSPEDVYFALLTIFHEDMHGEAFLYTRQTLSYPAPRLTGDVIRPIRPIRLIEHSQAHDDVHVPGGTFQLGATPDEPFVFDNEKWAHPVEIRPFAVARHAVTQAKFSAFVDDGGYDRQPCWSEAGWRWRTEANAVHPVYWQREAPGRWLRRDFNCWVPLEPNRPVIHVNWYEADAYCRWAGRRLPTEAEWEVAAAAEPDPSGKELSDVKRRFPWGDELPTPRRAHLDARGLGCIDVDELPEGDSALGCRQMIGNVWEWTASDFLPYPGFAADPYREYSAPWFGNHKVLRGGCLATRSRLLRNTWRNFYRPERRDVWAGFRTCAVRD